MIEKMDAIDHLKQLVDAGARAMIEQDPGVSSYRVAEALVARLGHHPGPNDDADHLVKNIIEGCAISAHAEVALRRLLRDLPADVVRV